MGTLRRAHGRAAVQLGHAAPLRRLLALAARGRQSCPAAAAAAAAPAAAGIAGIAPQRRSPPMRQDAAERPKQAPACRPYAAAAGRSPERRWRLRWRLRHTETATTAADSSSSTPSMRSAPGSPAPAAAPPPALIAALTAAAAASSPPPSPPAAAAAAASAAAVAVAAAAAAAAAAPSSSPLPLVAPRPTVPTNASATAAHSTPCSFSFRKRWLYTARPTKPTPLIGCTIDTCR
jgi:hypothetical protein